MRRLRTLFLIAGRRCFASGISGLIIRHNAGLVRDEFFLRRIHRRFGYRPDLTRLRVVIGFLHEPGSPAARSLRAPASPTAHGGRDWLPRRSFAWRPDTRPPETPEASGQLAFCRLLRWARRPIETAMRQPWREAVDMNPPAPQANEDDDIDPEEIQSASDETPTDVTAPELNEQTKDLTAWDEPPAASRTAAPKVLPEDAVSIAEQLVDEGADEADRDLRLAAADPDFEP